MNRCSVIAFFVFLLLLNGAVCDCDCNTWSLIWDENDCHQFLEGKFNYPENECTHISDKQIDNILIKFHMFVGHLQKMVKAVSEGRILYVSERLHDFWSNHLYIRPVIPINIGEIDGNYDLAFLVGSSWMNCSELLHVYDPKIGSQQHVIINNIKIYIKDYFFILSNVDNFFSSTMDDFISIV